MHDVVPLRLRPAENEERKISPVKNLLLIFNAKNLQISGQKFFTLFVIFSFLFSIISVHFVAADDSTSSTDHGLYDSGEQQSAGSAVYRATQPGQNMNPQPYPEQLYREFEPPTTNEFSFADVILLFSAAVSIFLFAWKRQNEEEEGKSPTFWAIDN